MIEFILFCLSTIGMSHIVVDASIMQWFRDFVKKASNKLRFPKFGAVVDCYLCSAFWCGLLMGLIWISYNPFKIFACGCAGGFISQFAAVLFNYLEAATIVNLPEENKK